MVLNLYIIVTNHHSHIQFSGVTTFVSLLPYYFYQNYYYCFLLFLITFAFRFSFITISSVVSISFQIFQNL